MGHLWDKGGRSKDRLALFLYGGLLSGIQRDPEARAGTRAKGDSPSPMYGRALAYKTCIQNLKKLLGKRLHSQHE